MLQVAIATSLYLPRYLGTQAMIECHQQTTFIPLLNYWDYSEN